MDAGEAEVDRAFWEGNTLTAWKDSAAAVAMLSLFSLLLDRIFEVCLSIYLSIRKKNSVIGTSV
jgi:hypothetical protein